ncbi:hypothetical protein DASB73_031540 [Starmerella bacillaris]|uniref:Uncharacterized protein n=1 Tax=Starmerella bacillaris TaxID=1247836 RepID=A0AAV5RM67_STABA|nr:hypothetical protein DASB73_031540 [Starmerella bacillaris]
MPCEITSPPINTSTVLNPNDIMTSMRFSANGSFILPRVHTSKFAKTPTITTVVSTTVSYAMMCASVETECISGDPRL